MQWSRIRLFYYYSLQPKRLEGRPTTEKSPLRGRKKAAAPDKRPGARAQNDFDSCIVLKRRPKCFGGKKYKNSLKCGKNLAIKRNTDESCNSLSVFYLVPIAHDPAV